MKLLCDCFDGYVPKRGDIVQTNCGDRRERTCMILRVRRTRKRGRFNLWAERWWQLEPDFRMRLFASAERAGGQSIIHFRRYKLKKRRPDLTRVVE